MPFSLVLVSLHREVLTDLSSSQGLPGLFSLLKVKLAFVAM